MSRFTGLDLDIYLRKSRKDIEEERKASENGEDYDTLERHRRRLIDVVKKENHNILEIHDEIVSGEFISERPKIQKLIRRVEAGEVEAVLVIDLDRLGRGDMLDQGLLDRAFRYSGTKIITPTETYDPNDEAWELVFGVKSLLARQELKSITKRLQSGRRDSASEGKSISKKPPYGYLRDENLKLYPDPDTSHVVMMIFELMSSNDYGRRTVAEELNRFSIPSPSGGEWESSSVSAIIENEVYTGKIIWGKYKSRKKNGKYERIKQPKDKWTVKENAHKPLVSKELFKAANEAYKGRWRPHTTKTRKLSNPLAGIIKCEVCGKALLYQPRKNRPNNAIRCTNIACKGIQKGASMNLVEEKILSGLKEMMLSFDLPEVEQKNKGNKIPLIEEALQKKREELKETLDQKSNLHDLLEKGIYTVDVFVERQKVLAEREKKTKEELEVLSTELEKEQKQDIAQNEFAPKIKTVLESYNATDNIEKKNQLLKSVIEKATYLRKKDWTKKDQFVIQLYPRI